MRRNSRERREDEGWNWWGMAAGVAAAAGLYYVATRNQEEQTNQHQTDPDVDEDFHDDENDEQPNPTFRTGGFFGGNCSSSSVPEDIPRIVDETIVDRHQIPYKPYIINLDTLLEDVYCRHVALKKDEFKLHYEVFNRVFNNLHGKMKMVDQYYNRYSSDVKFAGSHFNRIKIKKPDEFDVDIVIRLPVDMEYNVLDRDRSDVIIEPKCPGFVQLRAGVQYQNIPYRDDPHINKVALSWLDNKNYILRSKFTDWFKSIVEKALNTFQKRNNLPYLEVDDVVYTIRTSSSGPAWSIVIEAPGFQLNVDLVPALKFSERRWPISSGYRRIPSGCETGYWLVVPKPNKDGQNYFDERRSWRLALQNQEKKLFYKTDKMRKVICLMKYYRDVQNMNKIASYFITTIFLNEVVELQKSDPEFWWKNNLQTCFKHMFNKFHTALAYQSIEYFWNKNHNLIGNLPPGVWRDYKCKVDKMYTALQDTRDYKNVAKCLLPPDTYLWYNKHMMFCRNSI